MITKALANVRIKDADQGLVEAVFSTFGVIDKDGDVTYKSSFDAGAPVVVSAYGHTSWEGELPVGKGHIRVTDTEAVADMQFFMDTTHGRDTFLTVKALSEEDSLQEWSYSLRDVVSERVEVDGRKARALTKISVKEVSPVLMGASIDTRTLTTKGVKQSASDIASMLREAGRERWADDDTWVYCADWDVDDSWAVFEVEPMDGGGRLIRVEFTRSDTEVVLADEELDVERVTNYAPKSGSRFLAQAKSVLAGVDLIVNRATGVVAHRASKGKGLGAESVEVITRLDGQLDALKQLLANPPEQISDADREFLRFVATTQGVTP